MLLATKLNVEYPAVSVTDFIVTFAPANKPWFDDVVNVTYPEASEEYETIFNAGNVNALTLNW